MRRLIVLLIFLSFSQLGLGQVVTDLKVTGRHAQLIERGKSAKTKKERKQEQVRQTRKKGEAMRDTLSTLDSAYLAIDRPTLPNDSLSIAIPEAKVTEKNELASRLEEQAGSLATQGGLTQAEGPDVSATGQPGMENLPGGQLPGDVSKANVPGLSPEGMSATAAIPSLNLNPGAMNRVKMQSLMENISFEKLTDAHLSMEALKTTYSSVPSLTDTSAWIKSRSLKGEPLIDRFFIGGNASITSTDPLAVDINLQLGFKIDRRWSTGIGVIWRETITGTRDTTLVTNTHGGSVFSRYKFGKGFFAMGEFSTLQNTPILDEQNQSGPWQHQYLLGIGREFSVLKFAQLTTTILYDFNFRHNDLHPRPFIVRIGYTIDKPNFKKGK